MGGFFSYSMFALMLGYYLVIKKHKPVWIFIIFAVVYFVISGLINVDDEKYFFIDLVKYLAIIVAGSEIAHRTSLKELYIILLIGSSSILIHATLFADNYGRYSGFYLDPNSAGFACLLGVALSFAISKERWRFLGLAFFTFCGILTFSRTFFLLWIVMVLISVIQNKKNLKYLGLGIGTIIFLISITSILKLNTDRLNILLGLVNQGVIVNDIGANSRTETWALYYELIYNSPFFGNGYQSFMSDKIYEVGVHNNYLRILGEAGIIPFILFVGIYLIILVKSILVFKTKPYLFLLAISLVILQLTNHNFDTIYHVTFVSIWIYLRFFIKDKEELLD